MAYSHFQTFGVLLAIVVATTAQVDPCKSYADLDEPYRSANYEPLQTDKLLCDRSLRDGWYRFVSKAGGEMPTSCVKHFHCGTHAPIWMNGKHPTVSDGIVTRKVCINMPVFGTDSKNCCPMTYDIQVKNCNGYYVYNLKRVQGCSMAYCAGDGIPCRPDEHSATGFTPCTKGAYPKMTGKPTLTGPHITADQQSFNFKCNIPYPTDEDANFDVVWLFGHKESKSVPPMVASGKQRVVELDQKFLLGNMGKTVTCKVRSYYGPGVKKSDLVESNGYWAGVEVTPSQITVSEGHQTAQVKLTSTIPIVCSHRFTCGIDFEMDIDSTDPNELVAAERCTRHISTNDWDPKAQKAEVTFDVLAVRDFKTDKNKKLALKFKPVFSFSPHIWNGYELPPVTVTTQDVQTQRCGATGDPHIQGFDQKKSYHLYRVGEFVFYKSTARPFEVHIRTWTCGNGRVSCICGVSAREGNDVIEIDMCHGRYGKTNPRLKVKSNNQLLEGTTIKRDKSGRSFMLNFPSGAWLKADTNARFMNVYVQAPSEDFQKTQGICGTFDGNANNDYTKMDGTVHNPKDRYPYAFFESWRVPYGKSLFDFVPPAQSQYEYNPQYCKCETGTGKVDCRVGNRITDPVAKQTRTWKDLTSQVNKKTRLRRGTTYHDLDSDEDTFYVFKYGLDFKPSVPNFPTASGLTESTAREYCRQQLMKSSVFQECGKLPNVGIDGILDGCVEDLKISDDKEFAKASVSQLEDTCQEIILKDPANYIKGDNGTEIPPAFITEDLCPADCSLQGKCVKGVCVCDTGFTGDDCSVVKNKPPEIYEITRDGLCDIRSRPCRAAYLIVDNVMDSSTLTCRVREVEIVNGRPSTKPGPYQTTSATFESFREVSCQLPMPKVGRGKPAIGLLLSISNDGKLFSDEKLFLTFDSVCHVCTMDGCFQRPFSCLIEGRCYAAYETAIGNSANVCMPDKSVTSWSVRETTGVNNWTVTPTGCVCEFSPAYSYCACCVKGGCQCGEKNKNQCVQCGKLEQCGK